MKIAVVDGLPFVKVTLRHQGNSVELSSVLLDTGSVGTIFSVERMAEIGIRSSRDDIIHRISGIGGSEFVILKQVDVLAIDDSLLENVEIEVGALDYGFPLDGILGMDCLSRLGAVIDLAAMELHA
jgi:predicted aspartyl protease